MVMGIKICLEVVIQQIDLCFLALEQEVGFITGKMVVEKHHRHPFGNSIQILFEPGVDIVGAV
ncbi:hypothetical protein SDC9_122331 [bioreactor metagenome]|uniref:Uncharacterized protein n=1 Tax=bioreactor metagenome TaxID=1076179 RepID=A0A645CEE4_9ZZZZ